MQSLTTEILCAEAAKFSALESQHSEPSLYGITDGKAIGTYLEQKFKTYLAENYEFILGSSASGIDFPGLLVDMKVTSKQAIDFYSSLIFWDDKRPIKTKILNSLNLKALLAHTLDNDKAY